MNKEQHKKLELAFRINNLRVNKYDDIQKAIFLKVEIAELFNELKIKPWHLGSGIAPQRDKDKILSEIADVLIFTLVGGESLSTIEKFLTEEIEILASLETYIDIVFSTRKTDHRALYIRALKLVRAIIDYTGAHVWYITLDNVLDALLEKTKYNAKRFGYPELDIK